MGGGIGMGNTCKPMAVSFQCMTKFTTNKKKSLFSQLVNTSESLLCAWTVPGTTAVMESFSFVHPGWLAHLLPSSFGTQWSSG